MALFHLSVTQTKRSAGQSAIASAAYRAGERLYSEYYGEYSDYTRKGGVICSDILLPSHAPPEYADRQTLCKAMSKLYASWAFFPRSAFSTAFHRVWRYAYSGGAWDEMCIRDRVNSSCSNVRYFPASP